VRTSLARDVARDEGVVGLEIMGGRRVGRLVLANRLGGGLEDGRLGRLELAAGLCPSVVEVGKVTKVPTSRARWSAVLCNRLCFKQTNRASQTCFTPPGRTLQNLVMASTVRYSFETPVTRTVLDWARDECSLEMRKSWRRTIKAASSRLMR
jgi:hypothetical protein